MRQQVLELLQGISILLAFLVALFTLWHDRILAGLTSTVTETPSDIKANIFLLSSILRLHLMPILTLGLAMSFLMAPLFFRILGQTLVPGAVYDELLALYCLLFLATSYITMWAIRKCHTYKGTIGKRRDELEGAERRKKQTLEKVLHKRSM